MARLASHGRHVIIDCIWYQKAICEDGKILRNNGRGWKICANVKKEYTWQQAADIKQRSLTALYETLPTVKALKEWLDKHVKSRAKRAYLKMALDYLGNDVDGFWSELHDQSYNPDVPQLDLDECVEICRLYELAVKDLLAYRAAKRGVAQPQVSTP